MIKDGCKQGVVSEVSAGTRFLRSVVAEQINCVFVRFLGLLFRESFGNVRKTLCNIFIRLGRSLKKGGAERRSEMLCLFERRVGCQIAFVCSYCKNHIT